MYSGAVAEQGKKQGETQRNQTREKAQHRGHALVTHTFSTTTKLWLCQSIAISNII